jgi:hypothetical protein
MSEEQEEEEIVVANRPVRELVERDRRLVRAGPRTTVRGAAEMITDHRAGSILVMHA